MVMMKVPLCVVKCLDIDGGGDVTGEVLGPGGDAGDEGGEAVAGEEPGHSSHDGAGAHQVGCRHGVVRPLSGCRPQGAELNPGQDAAQY